MRYGLRARSLIRGAATPSGAIAATQVYHGYDAAHEKILRSMVVAPARREQDRIVDGFGQETLLECIPFCTSFDLSD